MDMKRVNLAVVAKSSTPGADNARDMVMINKLSQRELAPEEVFTFRLHTCDNDVDRDTDAFTIDALVELSAFLDGKTILSDHAHRTENQVARIYRTDVEDIPGGATKTGDQLVRLVAHCYMPRTEANKEFITSIEAGIRKEASIGCSVSAYLCSICGKNQLEAPCGHRKGQQYDGKLCYHKLAGITDAYEVSFVAVPAQRRAGVIKSYIPNNSYRKGDKLMGIEFLQEKIKGLTAQIAEKKAQMEGAQDIAIYKSLSTEVAEMENDRDSFKQMVADMLNVHDGISTEKEFQPLMALKTSGKPDEDAGDDDPTNAMAYRKAFKAFVQAGTPIPADVCKANANTLTSDVGSAIPTVLVDRIIEKMETIGMILPMVTKTSYAAGVNIPTSTVKPVATWVLEGSGSDRQKKTTGVITFTNHKLRCEISMSMEVSVMALSAFEASFVRQVSEAMVKAQEQSILNGDGTSRPKGILTETPATGQALTATVLDYKLLVDAEAALPQAYENGAVWSMTKKTFMGFVGMVDDQKQPIARVNYGIAGAPERTLLGRSVVLCGDYMDSFSATLEAGTVFAFLYNYSDYILNTIYDMGVTRKQDWDTEDMLTKAVMSVDGRSVDNGSLVTIAMGA